MSSDFQINCIPVGKISYDYNRVVWIIPNFDEEIARLWLKCPPFRLMGSEWFLQLFPGLSGPVGNGMDWLEVVIKLPSKTYAVEMKRLRLRVGIAGRSLEISKTFEPDDIIKYKHCNTLFDFESLNADWVPDGFLRVFFAIEQLEFNSKDETLNEVDAKLGNEDSEQRMKSICKEMSNLNLEQNGFSKLQHDLKEMLQNGNTSDVVLKVDNQEFNAHRCILAARSPVFSAMMMHDTKEKKTGVIDIVDIDSDIFFSLLKYLYTGSVENVTSENAQKLYGAADKYQVCELKKACLNHMLNNISVDNFCDLLTLSLLYEERDLTNRCSQFFMKNSLEIVKTPKWQIFMSENPVAANELYIKQLELKN